jgi:phage major head subunit gpT-like protein
MKRYFHSMLAWVLLIGGCLTVAAVPESASAMAGGAFPHLDSLPLFAIGGMLVNKTVIADVFTNLKATFNKAFEAAPAKWEKIAMLIPSSSSQNDYSWLSAFPRMRKWAGDKVVKALAAFKYTVTNDDWEATVEVRRNDIDDDNLGIYGPQAQSAGYSAKQLPDEIVFDLVNNGFTAQCYDGQYFFDTDHVVAGSSVSNKGTVALSCSTLALAKASYGAARTAMRKVKDDEGRPLGIVPNVLLVPPALEDEANLLMTVDKLEDGKPNPYKGTAEVVVGERLTSDTAWFLLDTTKPVKPLVYQERKKPVFVQQTEMSADDVFNRAVYKFGAEARAAGGYAFWQMAYGSTGTA